MVTKMNALTLCVGIVIVFLTIVTLSGTASAYPKDISFGDRFGSHHHYYDFNRNLPPRTVGGYYVGHYYNPYNKIYVSVRTSRSDIGDVYHYGFGIGGHRHPNIINRYGIDGYHGHFFREDFAKHYG